MITCLLICEYLAALCAKDTCCAVVTIIYDVQDLCSLLTSAEWDIWPTLWVKHLAIIVHMFYLKILLHTSQTICIFNQSNFPGQTALFFKISLHAFNFIFQI